MKLHKGGSLFLPYCHAPSYVASPKTELVAGADLHAEQAEIFGERWELSSDHIYSDYREMLEKENLDLVSICTTARVRSTIVQDVARSGVKGIWGRKTDLAQSCRSGYDGRCLSRERCCDGNKLCQTLESLL